MELKKSISSQSENIWKEYSIVELCKTLTKQTGFDYTAYIKPSLKNNFEEGTIPFIQNKDFNGKWMNFSTDYFIPFNIAKNFPRILLDEKSLLISISGSIGNVGIFNCQQIAFIGGAIAIAKMKNPIHVDWIAYYLQSNLGQQKLLGNVKAGSHQNLTLEDIRKFILPIPSENEIKIIAKTLSDIDDLVICLEKLIEKKKNIKQGAIQHLFKPKKGWVNKKLGDLVLYKNGTAHENCVVDYGNFIIVNSKFISTDGQVVKYSNNLLSPVSKGEILMVLSDVPNGRAISKCFLVEKDNKYTLNQRICSLNPINTDSKFLFYLLNRNPYFLSFDDGAKQTNLRNLDVLNCPLTIPDNIEEQKHISNIISDLYLEIDILEKKLVKTKLIKQGMMQNLLTGKIRLV